jgi:hypothetical protein
MNETPGSVVSRRVHVGEGLVCMLYVGEVLNGDDIVRRSVSMCVSVN